MLKRTSIVLLLTLVIAIVALFVYTEANAALCVLRSPSGACKLWTGTLICDVGATGLGNCESNDWTIGCSATGSGWWAVACGNPGINEWTAPGINLAEYTGTLSGTYTVEPTNCDSNGNAYLTIHMPTPQSILNDLVVACPNPNWTARDAVPCSAEVKATQYDALGCTVADATLECTIDCANLGWNVDTQTFEVRQYDCQRTSLNRYKTPICP